MLNEYVDQKVNKKHLKYAVKKNGKSVQKTCTKIGKFVICASVEKVNHIIGNKTIDNSKEIIVLTFNFWKYATVLRVNFNFLFIIIYKLCFLIYSWNTSNMWFVHTVFTFAFWVHLSLSVSLSFSFFLPFLQF